MVHAFPKIYNHKGHEGSRRKSKKRTAGPEARRFHCSSSRRLYAASFVASDLTGDRSGWALTIFICFQSYGSSLPQSRHTTYVPVANAARLRGPFFIVIGKLYRWCQQPKSASTTRPNISLPPTECRKGWEARRSGIQLLRFSFSGKGSSDRR